VKILHTADLHLTETATERWSALDELVKTARSHQADALVIAGDLFDRNIEAENMRSQLRMALGGADFQTVILPGNHDHAAYRSGLYYGNNVTVINSWEEPVCLGEVVIWGLPYSRISGDRLAGILIEMGKRMDSEQNNILLFHGELLDAYFSRQDLGDEGDQRYMPARLSYFKTLPVSYILSGHFHSRYSSWKVPGGGLFIYPGSPVAVTRRETGQRAANLVTIGEEPEEIALNSYHYEELVISLDPFSSEDPLALLDQKLQAAHPGAKVILSIEGLYNGMAVGMDEKELAAAIREKAAGRLAGEPVENFYDVRHVLEDDLFRQFKARLATAGCPPELAGQINEMAIRAFRAVKSCS
jgi:DNA repair protein SbcD/Mre11